MYVWPLLCSTCIFCYPSFTARNNFDRAVLTYKLISTNSATCSSVIDYELDEGFLIFTFFMITEDKYTCVCIHNLMLVLVVNRPITGKGAKFRISLLPAHLLYNVKL